MKKTHKGLIFVGIYIMLIILLANLTSANLGTFQQNEAVDIRVLANCSSVNITEVNDGETTYIINQPMDNIGGQTFNYSFSNTSKIGTYSYSWNNPCVDCASNECGNSFEVTPTGEETNGWKITIQIFASLSTLFLMGLFLFLSSSGMKTDRLGNEEKPILRFFFVGVSLVFLVAHIVLTNIIIHDTMGIGTLAGAYTNVMYIFFTIIVLAFMYTVTKIIVSEMDVFQRRCGLK